MKVRVCVVLLMIAALSFYPTQPLSAQPLFSPAPQVRMKPHGFMKRTDRPGCATRDNDQAFSSFRILF
jgi:hypothetical protein